MNHSGGTTCGAVKNDGRRLKFLLVILLLVSLPALIYGCLFAAVMAPYLVNDVVNSGSATGSKALERAADVLGDVDGGRWKDKATNARAEWTAPDFHGDETAYFGFDLPLSYVPAFEAAIEAAWSDHKLYAGPDKIKEMPRADDPKWMYEPLPDAVYYERGVDTVGISRTTGRVLVRRWEW